MGNIRCARVLVPHAANAMLVGSVRQAGVGNQRLPASRLRAERKLTRALADHERVLSLANGRAVT